MIQSIRQIKLRSFRGLRNTYWWVFFQAVFSGQTMAKLYSHGVSFGPSEIL